MKNKILIFSFFLFSIISKAQDINSVLRQINYQNDNLITLSDLVHFYKKELEKNNIKLQVADHAFNKAVYNHQINSDNLTVVKFFATWCNPCRQWAPLFKQVTQQVKTVKLTTNPSIEIKVNYIEVDIDLFTEIKIQNNVRIVPSTLMFKQGKLVDRITGRVPQEELIKRIYDAAQK